MCGACGELRPEAHLTLIIIVNCVESLEMRSSFDEMIRKLESGVNILKIGKFRDSLITNVDFH